jgi:hypothetical protein
MSTHYVTLLHYTHYIRSRDSSVGIATGYWLNNRKDGFRVQAAIIFSSPRRPNWLWRPSSLQFNGYRSLLLKGLKRPGRFCYSLSRPQGHSAAGNIRSIEKFNDLIGIRNRHIPGWSIVPQPTTLPRVPII